MFIGDTEFTIVGILKEAKQSYGGNPNEEIYITTDAGKEYLKIKNIETMIVMPMARGSRILEKGIERQIWNDGYLLYYVQ